MFDPAKFAMQMIQNNPQVMNNPMAKQYLEIIQNGDSAKGQEVANNILKTYGMIKMRSSEPLTVSGMFRDAITMIPTRVRIKRK